MKRFYLLMIWNDVEPELFGPFPTHVERDAKAKELREAEGREHGLFPLDIVADEPIEVEVETYSGGFFPDDDVSDEE